MSDPECDMPSACDLALPPSALYPSFWPQFLIHRSFISNSVINHDDLTDIYVHAVAMYTMVDGGFVHDAEPLTSVCGEASWMCQYLGISEALISMIVLGS